MKNRLGLWCDSCKEYVNGAVATGMPEMEVIIFNGRDGAVFATVPRIVIDKVRTWLFKDDIAVCVQCNKRLKWKDYNTFYITVVITEGNYSEKRIALIPAPTEELASEILNDGWRGKRTSPIILPDDRWEYANYTISSISKIGNSDDDLLEEEDEIHIIYNLNDIDSSEEGLFNG